VSKQGTAGVTLVDCGVSLYVIVELGEVEIATEGANDPGGHRTVEPQRVTDCDHEITLAQRVAVAQLDRNEGPPSCSVDQTLVLRTAGVLERCDVVGGDMHQAVPSGADAIS
jgi:hypothetical protein